MNNRNAPNPYGFVSLDSSVMAQQAYDISLSLDVPRSPPNLEAGNFMLDLRMLSPAYKSTPTSALDVHKIPTDAIVFSSRRHAILTYHSLIVTLSKQIASLPWYILGWRREAEKLEIKMAEGVVFAKGWMNTPQMVYLELQGRGQDIQVYDVKLMLRAKFSGLRWMMYNHRIISFCVGTTAFWLAEVLFAALAWLALSSWFHTTESGGKGRAEIKGDETDSAVIKTEDGALETDELDLSDTPRSFPTYGRQAPLKYVPVKVEEDRDGVALDEAAPAIGEADDELEDPVDVSRDVGMRDSGIGTSFSEGGGGLQRRRSKGARGRV